MIGVSISTKWLIEGNGIPTPANQFLPQLYDLGVRSLELRDIKPGFDPERIYTCANILWDRGFNVTLHARAASVETAVEDVFGPLRKVLMHMRQEKVVVVIHPVVGNNSAMLTALADHIDQNNYPVVIALENNRLLPDKTEGDSTELVLEAVTKANRNNIGICFDMGHYAYYLKKNHPENLMQLPSPEFLKKVVHTHIHGMNSLRTHFPLDQFELNLSHYLKNLSFNYYGVYNIELSFGRFKELRTPEDAILGSVETLANAMPYEARSYDGYRQNYDREVISACTVFDREGGTYMGLMNSSSYLFNTNGFMWGMDISHQACTRLAKSPSQTARLLQPLSLMIITHEHSDHFQKKTVVSALAKNDDLMWVIPDFLLDQAIACGVRKEKIFVAKAGEIIKYGPLTILPFTGRHLRPVTLKGKLCLGYHITQDNGLTMAFPADVRDYTLEGLPELGRADYCFAHVWLGDGNCLETDFSPLDSQWAQFMLHFSDKRILLTHLDGMRREEFIWRPHHAMHLSQCIHAQSPNTVTLIPQRGEVIRL